MRFVLCLILLLCFALAADAGPFRRSGCPGGSCPVTPSVPAADYAKPFNPLDLTMDYRKLERDALSAQPVVTQPQACAGGQCGERPANRFGRVTVRVFRR